MVPDIAMMPAIATTIATTIATFRNLATFDSADASSTTPRTGADNNPAGPVTAITTATAGNLRCARRAAPRPNWQFQPGRASNIDGQILFMGSIRNLDTNASPECGTLSDLPGFLSTTRR